MRILIHNLFIIISLLFLVNTLFAQEVAYELRHPDDYYYYSPMTLNGDWLFTPNGIEGSEAVSIYKKENHKWEYYNKIQGASWDFGYRSDSYDDWLVVGDQSDWTEPGEIPQSLHFYQLDDGNWTFRQKFTKDFSYFTSAISMYGDWLVSGDDRNDSVYVYYLNNGVWQEQQSIAFEDSLHADFIGSPNFGDRVKMYGDYFVVHASNMAMNSLSGMYGAFYLYKRQANNNWTKIHTIRIPDIMGPQIGFKDFDITDGMFAFSAVNSGEVGEVYVISFDDTSYQVMDSFVPNTNFYTGNALKLTETELVFTNPYMASNGGMIYRYKRVNDAWQENGSFTNPVANTYMGSDVEIDDRQLLVSANSSIQVIGVKSPTLTSVHQGNSKSNTKVTWENNSAIENLRFVINRDGEEIATTSGSARSYFDYEGIPGKMHAYSVSALAVDENWLSVPAYGHGYKQPSGIIEGVVQTPLGSGVKDVQVSFEPNGITMHRALYVDSASNALTVSRFTDAPETSITVSFWMKSNPANQGVLFDFNSENNDNAFRISNPQNITIALNNNMVETHVNLDDGQWHHLAVSWRNTDGQMFLYDNGVEAFQTKFLAGETFLVPDASIYFGADHSYAFGDSLFNPFSGWLDDLRIWNVFRTDSIIALDMNRRFIGNEDNLISYYNFDDPQRFDVSFVPNIVWKRSNHGTIVNPVYENNSNNVIHQQRETFTDAAGKFSFKNVYFDEARDFLLLPFKQDHGFSPGSVFLELDLNDPADKNVIIIDTTSFTVSGKVYYASTDCPLPGAELILNGKGTGVFTDEEGAYLLTIEDPGSVLLEVSFADSAMAHMFVPSSLNLEINDNIFDADFADISTSKLYGRVGAACDNSLGAATINIISANQCYSRTIQTEADGTYSIELPSQEYIVTANFDGLPILFDIVNTDLTFQDTLLNFIDREPPVISISGLPETCFDVPVVGQYEQYYLTIEVLDNFAENSCPVDTGFITIYDAVGGNPDEPVTLKISNGQAHYILQPGLPNILDGGDHPFQKLFQVVANVDGVNSSLEQWMLVTGHSPQGETFVTKTPELPLMILRDPPGDQSYSFLEKGSSTTTNFGLSAGLSASAGVYTEAKIGAGIPIPFTGVVIGARSHFQAEIMAGIEGNVGVSLNTTISQTERFSTSDADNITGSKGDVFLGASLNMIYALTHIIDFDETTCSVIQDTQLVWGSDSINTEYIYTEDHIRNTLLPQLRLLRSLASPDSVVLLGTYIDVWEQVLVENERLKRNAKKEKNLSFSAGTKREYSSNTTSDSTLHIDFTTFIESKIKIGAGFGDTKFSDIEVGVAANFRWSVTGTYDGSSQSSKTVGYVLADDDPGDFFSVDVKSDPVYNTPVFDLVSGTSSCPWEPGSQPRDGVQLAMDSYIKNDVPLGEKAAFALYIGNTSQSGETRDYALSVIQASNLDGAIISVGGVVIEDALNYTIPAGEQIKATLAVERGPLAWDYEDLKIRLYSPCDPSIADTINFSVHFQSPCTSVNIFRPYSNWLVNASNKDTLAVVLNDYNRTDPDLEMILLEYRRMGGNWKTAFTILKNELPNNYITKTWNVSALANGQYELRAVARCQSGLSYSPILKGKIDRTALIVFGNPQPSDGVLNIGDEIRIAFSEALQCGSLSDNAVLLEDEDGNIIASQMACSDKELIITIEQPLEELEGKLITATVTSVKDISGNVLREPYTWSFLVNLNPVHWSVSNTQLNFYKNNEPLIAASLLNTGIANESFNLVSLPAWLTASSLSGSIPPAGIANITFEISKNLNPGTFTDTLYAETSRGNEPFYVELNVLAEPPLWIVNSAAYSYSMNVTAQLNIEGNPSNDTFDMVAAFVGNDVRGMANVQYVSERYGYLAFITIYSHTASGESISFSGWDASAGSEYANVSETFTFQDGGELGGLANPIILNPEGVAQNINLNSGWSWISLNVHQNPMNINDVLAAVDAQQGDIIKSQQQFAQYVDGGGWQGSLQQMETGETYLVKLSNPSSLRYIGNLVRKNEKFLQLQQGWSWIGLVGNRIVDINTALSDLKPSDGDRIKSQIAFAEYDAQSAAWLGSLEFLEPGKGYKIKTNATVDFTFSGLEKVHNIISVEGAPENWLVKPELYEYNMNIVSRLDFGTRSKLDSLDIIAAFVDGECRGVTNPVYIPALNRYQVFLTVFGEGDSSDVRFKMLEHETGVVYSAGDVITFAADTTLGSIEKPLTIKSAYATNEGALPTTFQLYQNHPNPFNPTTSIRYEVPTRTEVSLIIYNVLGQQVRTVVNTTQNAGRYLVEIDGSTLSSGIYFYRFEAGNFTKVRKMLLVK